jgi:hypothetical protein
LGARQKLNDAHFNGALLIAGLLGWWTESWFIFLVALLGLIGLATHSGGIRPSSRHKRK